MITLLDKALLIEAYVRPISKTFGEDSERHASLNRLYDAGLIQVKAHEEAIEVTESGRCLVEAMRSIPLPVISWVIPAVSEPARHE